jgi:16S rRNA (adenine1518-N6/adenine1519-N6)-dimethyltransferase
MQSKNQIKSLLESAGITVKKRFGQNFLIDANLMRLLTDSANISKNDIILEVGCGTGSLTELLAEKACFVISVEIDAGLAKIAHKQLKDKKNVQIINADVLKNKRSINPEVSDSVKSAKAKYNGRLLLISNLSYNIASPLILNLITGPLVVDALYVTIQKEVAERMTADAGNKSYGTLSIILNATGNVKIIRSLPPSVFWPQPKVDSAMVSFIRDEKKIKAIKDMNLFCTIVKLFMQHRRKMLKAIVKLAPTREKNNYSWQFIFEKSGIDPEKRPDNLTAADFVSLANTCQQFLT